MPDDEVSFIDTNVLVYAHDRSETRKQPIAQALLADLWERRAGVLSTQVLQEFYVVATRRFDPPMSRAAARDVVTLYGEWSIAQVDVALIIAASNLEERHTFSFWDDQIIEAARRSGAKRLLSEDLQGGRRIGGVMIEDPFR